MQYNYLGKSDIKVSAIGIGTMSFDFNDQNEIERLLRFAIDNGVNFIDTADLYDKGLNEDIVGKTIKSFREKIVLATKVGNKWRNDGSGWDWDVSPKYILKAIDLSLKRLRTDYIDLYQIHGGTNQDNTEEVISTLEDLKTAGKIRSYGISSIRPNVFVKYCEQSNLVSNMMQYSILDNRLEEFFPLFQDNRVSVLARGVIAQGLLINKLPKSYLEYSLEEVTELQEKIKLISTRCDVSATTIALSYVLLNPVVSSAVIGVRTLAQLKDVLRQYKPDLISNLNFEDLPLRKIKYVDHRL